MVDPTEMETAALQSCLRPLGEAVAEIGMQRPLADYTPAEILTVIEAVVTAYQDFMLAEHERLAAKERAAIEPYLLRALAPPPSQGPR